MKYEDLRFTRKQAERILAEAAEREDRENNGEPSEEISYSQLVKIAEESTIDPKYLKASTKQLVKEAGGLEKAAIRNIIQNTKNAFGTFAKRFPESIFFAPTSIRRDSGDSTFYSLNAIIGNIFVIAGEINMAMGSTFSIGEEIIVSMRDYTELGAYLLAIHLGTNIGSGLYEWYQHEKKKLIKEMDSEEVTNP